MTSEPLTTPDPPAPPEAEAAPDLLPPTGDTGEGNSGTEDVNPAAAAPEPPD